MGLSRRRRELLLAENSPPLIVGRFTSEPADDLKFLEEVNSELFYHFLARYFVNIRVAVAKKLDSSEVVVKGREKVVKSVWMNRAASHGVSKWANRHFFLPLCESQLRSSSSYQALMHSNESVYQKTVQAFEEFEVVVAAELEEASLLDYSKGVIGGRKLVQDTVFNGQRFRKELPVLRTLIDYIDALMFWPIFAWFLELNKIVVGRSTLNSETLLICRWDDLAKSNLVPEEAIEGYFVPMCDSINRLSARFIELVGSSPTLTEAASIFLRTWEKSVNSELSKKQKSVNTAQVKTKRTPRSARASGSQSVCH